MFSGKKKIISVLVQLSYIFFLHYMNIEIFDIGINKYPRTAATKQRHIFLFYATPFFENVL